VGRYVVTTVLGAVVILAPLGCSLLLGEGFSDPQPAEAGQADPAVLDATTELDDGAKDIATTSDVDAADAGADPNMLVNPDFETPDCAGWYSEYAVPAEIAVPRSGVRGCLVCGVAGNVQAQFYQPVPVAVAPGAAFLGELWVRAAPDEVAPVATELGLEVDIRGAAGEQAHPVRHCELWDEAPRLGVGAPQRDDHVDDRCGDGGPALPPLPGRHTDLRRRRQRATREDGRVNRARAPRRRWRPRSVEQDELGRRLPDEPEAFRRVIALWTS